MISSIVVASAALVTVATTAQVADPAGGAGMTVDFWSGPYLGVYTGYGTGRARDVDASGPDSYRDIDGWLGGVQLGLNTRMNGFVLGVEGDVAATGIGFSDVAKASASTAISTGWRRYEDVSASFRANASWSTAPRVLHLPASTSTSMAVASFSAATAPTPAGH